MASPARWGWHQLDARWAARLVAEAGVGRGDRVLDVGAGAGALTEPLLRAGARVIAVEAHPGRARGLAARFGDDIVVVRADATDLRLPGRPFHVVANPPFSVTSALLRRLLHSGSHLLSAHLVLQDQAARRWASSAAPGWNRWSHDYVAQLGPVVQRSAFRPAPPVPARVLVLRRRSGSRPGRRR